MRETTDRPSWAMLTDLYQLTMAQGYCKAGLAERDAIFQLTFREHPFGGGFTVACGLSTALEAISNFQFCDAELEYLRSVNGSDDRPIFQDDFLEQLSAFELACDLDAIPEGTVVMPHEPLLRVRGPLWQCQLLETLMLNVINFQTLLATKAARMRIAAGSDMVLEFGLRRAQGVDGGLSASRAAYVGGCNATSNVMAGQRFGIPIRGTHAHSWVLAFEDEETAFQAYAEALPNNCVLLVDTFNTLRGVERAAHVGKQLQQQGHELIGIRLDSGDLAQLSRQARDILNRHQLEKAVIVASNDLDEYEIERLKSAGAEIDVWGVGTRLATAYEQPALGGVYKLSALRTPTSWKPCIKLSEDPVKVSNPGLIQARRYYSQGKILEDVLFDELSVNGPASSDRPNDYEDLLVPVIQRGSQVYDCPSATEARSRTLRQLSALPEPVKRLSGGDCLSVKLDEHLQRQKDDLIAARRRNA